MAPKIYMTIGISGSGKSKFTDYVKDSLSAEEINADNIRAELTGDVSNQKQNEEVWKCVERKTTAELAGGHNVILSNTNLHLRAIKDLRKKYPYNEIVVFVMEDAFNKELCYNRIQDDLADGKVRSNVPLEIIERQHDNFNNLVHELEDFHDDKVSVNFVTKDFVVKRQ